MAVPTSKADKVILGLYGAWMVVVVGLSFFNGGMSLDNITRLLILLFLGIQFLLFRVTKIDPQKVRPRLAFISVAVLFAAVVEGCYMISNPVFASLTFKAGMSPAAMLGYYAIDLTFTVPVYIVVFWTMWGLINRYRYPLWAYVILMALGQALGDGFFSFLAAPGMLLFLPYVMTNYHAMNVVPYLAVRQRLNPQKGGIRVLWGPLIIIGIYLIGGAVIIAVGKVFGLA
jgi:hypothetical protein